MKKLFTLAAVLFFSYCLYTFANTMWYEYGGDKQADIASKEFNERYKRDSILLALDMETIRRY